MSEGIVRVSGNLPEDLNVKGMGVGQAKQREPSLLRWKLLLAESSHRTNKTSLITLSPLSVAEEQTVGPWKNISHFL